MSYPGSIYYVKVWKNVHKNLSFRIFEPAINCKGKIKMTLPIYKFKEKIRYRLKTRHHKGHGIHSPYLYRFISSVIQEKYPYYCFEQLENNSEFADSYLSRQQYKKDKRCGEIIFRIIQNAQFQHLLELGKTTGFETQYMSMANSKAKCISESNTAELATSTLLNQFKTLDFVFFNKMAGYQYTLDCFNSCLAKKNNDSIFVFKDIHENPDMKKAWKKIKTKEGVQVTMDIFDLGIILFKPELEKRNYVLNTK